MKKAAKRSTFGFREMHQRNLRLRFWTSGKSDEELGEVIVDLHMIVHKVKWWAERAYTWKSIIHRSSKGLLFLTFIKKVVHYMCNEMQFICSLLLNNYKLKQISDIHKSIILDKTNDLFKALETSLCSWIACLVK